ncbi:hypothetical protein LOTGIDRAFT_180305 [Lottia gigantea]|uniref:Uncharacterized protein n=1 Tax=Lottia gigantea TaxID=225164 RepID=V4AVT9_LOTGI|nr:hypothetical protein LOTGIDRAFT_180305 [Lottia gigantea]ESP01493.1 hypothetical protein LOTGIDRAFT_180305 [Lottia gigantea]
MGPDARKSFAALRKKYGDIFSLYIGNKHVIVINGYEALREIFVKNGDVSSNRPKMAMMEVMGNYKGVVTSMGPLWREQRSTALAALRKMDFGKQSLEVKIHEELGYLLEAFSAKNREAFDPTHLLSAKVSNIVCSMLFGDRFEYEDEKFKLVLQLINDSLATAGSVAAMNFFPLLAHLPGDILNIKSLYQMRDTYEKNVLDPVIQGIRDNYDPNNCNSFVTHYLKEMENQKKNNPATTLDIENLRAICTDVFGAGTETTSTTLRWILLYFIHHPEIQEKCYKEIVEHVGTGRLPAMKDRDNLVYIQAIFTEALRISAVLPFGAPHSVKEDMKFRDFYFPKNCLMITNIDSVLNDKEIWGDPENFRPERFISEDGKIIKKDEFIPFFIGRRVCMGEALSRMELFLSIGALVQQFRFEPEGAKPPVIKGHFGITYSPMDYKLRAIPRE